MARSICLPRHAAVTRMAVFALFFITLAAATFSFGTRSAQAAQAALSWSAPTTFSDGTPLTDLKGYKLYTGTAPGSYGPGVDLGKVNSYTATNLNDGATYYFAVTAYNSAGDSSGYSNQVSVTTPAAPPVNTLYTITASAGTGGSISPSGATALTKGASQSYSIIPATGYKIAGVTVDGASVGAVSSYSFSNVTANHSISATFSANTASSYTITASAGTGGSITPAGATSLTSGTSKSYTVTPNTGYYVASVVVDGTAVVSNIAGGAGYSYTFNSVTASHTISATFAIRHYHLVSSAGANGAVTPPDSWVLYQGSQAIAITPASGYQVADVKVDGTSVGAVTSYTFSNLAADHTLSATFAVKAPSYTITASAGANGSITPAGATSVKGGTSQSYTVTPSTGYYVMSVVVDGATVASNIPSGGYTYTFSNLSGNHTISATFGVRYYNIVATAGTGGTITPGDSWVIYNSSPTVTITPASGKKIASVTVDGVSVGAVSSYTFKNVSAGHTVKASFL